ncbi:MAG: hypothetical protein CEE42_00810 [Promethearchaeota archaeon Loki_b31]|nr:MAG: hypothetical protein CEE42_00810 [Candidatus Lokiarchaeota archaeon Loki_b31]
MSYFESRLKINLNDFAEIERKLKFCQELRITNLILEPKNDIIKLNSELKQRISKISTLNLYYRINLRPNSLNDLKKLIQLYNNFSDIISVESMDKNIQIQAAKDSRVDIISFSDQNVIKTISPGIISLIKQNRSFIEFSLASIMTRNQAVQSRYLRSLYRAVQLAMQLKVNYIISGNFDDIFKLRHPRALISVCHTLLGIPLLSAKKAFSENVLTLINRVQARQDKNIIESGVKLLNEGEL